MSHDPTIRRAERADAAAISALVDRYVASGTLLPRSAEFIAERPSEFLVAVVDGRIVGCVHLDEYAPSLAEVRSLAVDPDYHGLRLGSRLLAGLEALARVRGHTTLFAVSNSEIFFRHHGYEPRDIPELDRERSEVSKFKGVYAKDIDAKPRS